MGTGSRPRTVVRAGEFECGRSAPLSSHSWQSGDPIAVVRAHQVINTFGLAAAAARCAVARQDSHSLSTGASALLRCPISCHTERPTATPASAGAARRRGPACPSIAIPHSRANEQASRPSLKHRLLQVVFTLSGQTSHNEDECRSQSGESDAPDGRCRASPRVSLWQDV